MSSGTTPGLKPLGHLSGGRRRMRRRRGGRFAGSASIVLIVAGVLMLSDVLTTLVWQEPVSAVVGLIKRSGTDTRYLSYRSMPLTSTELASLQRLGGEAARVAYLAGQERRTVPNGAAVGRLVIGKLGVSYDVVEGTTTGDLERGPAHYASTSLPGQGETVAIAGHRTTYLAPFRNLNELHRGDRIVLQMPYAKFTYVVSGQRVVRPNAWWITRNLGHERLVLSACNPLYSASQRIAVFARLARMQPSASVRRWI